MKNAILAAVVVTLTACAPSPANPAYFKGGEWTGVTAPAAVLPYVICMNPGATGSQEYARQVSDFLAPSVFAALKQSPGPGVETASLGGGACGELGALVNRNFELTPPLHAMLDSTFAKCKCNSVVIAASFVQTEENTNEVRDSTGNVVLTSKAQGFHASGNVASHIYVFTKDGLAFNSETSSDSATWMSQTGDTDLRKQAPKLTEKMMKGFPLQILGP
ncbi:hypothetical protein BH09MYX1_BH09MYX1_40830 [soil metagenome]